MSLVLFSCRATGQFIMFEETARRVFKVLGRPWTETGAFSCDELPEILRILDEEARKDKEREYFAKQISESYGQFMKDVDYGGDDGGADASTGGDGAEPSAAQPKQPAGRDGAQTVA